MSDAGEALVGRSYTRAVKLPSMMGQIHGVRLWGGPYTIPQVIAMAATLGLVAISYQLWASLGVVASLVLLIGLPVGAGLAVRGLQAGGQQLLVTVPGLLGAAAGSGRGKLGGRPLPHPRRPQPLAATCTVSVRKLQNDVMSPVVSKKPVPEPAPSARTGQQQTNSGDVPTVSAVRPAVLSGAAALLAQKGDRR